MSAQPLAVTVEREIPASADHLYRLISDVTKMGQWSPETVKAEWIGDVTEPAVGAQFKGSNALGSLKWSTKPTVTAAEPGRRFAFQVPGGAGPLWTYELISTANGTLVRESMKQERRSPAPIRLMQRMAGVRDREANLREAMTTTLERLAAAAVSTDATSR
jgi:uncharacterized protein YndB with AHSA1/START domain